MDNPKQNYPRSEARQLRDAPCHHCGKIGRVELEETPSLGGASLNPDVLVIWRCPDELCRGAQGFWTESQ